MAGKPAREGLIVLGVGWPLGQGRRWTRVMSSSELPTPIIRPTSHLSSHQVPIQLSISHLGGEFHFITLKRQN